MKVWLEQNSGIVIHQVDMICIVLFCIMFDIPESVLMVAYI